MSERRLDVAESRRAFGSGEMKAPAVPRSRWHEALDALPPPKGWVRVPRDELVRRDRLARWQVPRV